jgi:mono/diheme cytochrome c family protein
MTTSDSPLLSHAALWLTIVPLLAAPVVIAQDGDGRDRFVAYGCYQCHGFEGQGGDAVRIAPSAYPFKAFATLVRRPGNVMPAYPPEALSDEDLRAIYRYVRSIPEPLPKDDIALLQ